MAVVCGRAQHCSAPWSEQGLSPIRPLIGGSLGGLERCGPENRGYSGARGRVRPAAYEQGP